MTNDYLAALHREIAPALGCTEPIAVALCAAKAAETLGRVPEGLNVCASPNVIKNAMGVGIPGTNMAGLEIAAALGALAGKSAYRLEVLKEAGEADEARARKLLADVRVKTADNGRKLYIEVEAISGGHAARAIVENTHDNITYAALDGAVLLDRRRLCEAETEAEDLPLTVKGIYDFITRVEISELEFLRRGIEMNRRIAEEGVKGDYGMRVGKILMNGRADRSLNEYAAALTAAAADARMAGCTLPVMSSAGSGNQGLTATLPIVAAAERLYVPDAALLRALALSQLIGIHIKRHIGRLGVLCGCAISASVGAACGVVYLYGGGYPHVVYAVKNMISDISGMICDGAKPTCALKIATSVAGAMQCANLALHNVQAGSRDGIVEGDIERTIQNLGRVGNEGMREADGVILDIMTCKPAEG